MTQTITDLIQSNQDIRLDLSGIDEIKHYGVLGMKWGVRKQYLGKNAGKLKKGIRGDLNDPRYTVASPQRPTTKTYGQYVKDNKEFNKAYDKTFKASKKQLNEQIKSINSKYKNVDFRIDARSMREYYTEISTSFTNTLNASAKKYGQMSDGYSIGIDYGNMRDGFDYPDVYLLFNGKEIKHSESENIRVKLMVEFNAFGHILDIDLPSTFAHSFFEKYKDDTLTHYGVLGMKWGVRKARSKGESKSRKQSKSMTESELRAKNQALRLQIEYIELNRRLSTIEKTDSSVKKFAANVLQNSASQILTKTIVKAGTTQIDKLLGLPSDKGSKKK